MYLFLYVETPKYLLYYRRQVQRSVFHLEHIRDSVSDAMMSYFHNLSLAAEEPLFDYCMYFP